ncbi:kelch-like protein 35 [Pezoporus wallicus]|uniref:kelch-like protein 35 n=1 Tax=Pezoporus wallicus TaxID=35540 RepID=UPI00255186FC|nr:kelch-like protein 35 [Pezoporus wallicus]XP_061314079.1 kelch-like protein 35 [Pezoporus flaviventris]
MHRMLKEESSFRTSSLEKVTRDPSKEKLHMKLCSGSCHAEQILQTLNSYRQSGIFTDVVLLIDGQEFPCHRATLSANSTYFRAMFGGKLKEGHQDIINIQKIPASTMSLLLDYMYGGSIIIQEDNVESILELSDLLQISKLRDACVTFLEGQLHPCNCLGIMKFADSFSIASLTEKSKRFMLECFVEVSCHEEFLEMDVKELVEYLSDEELVVPKEEVVFEAVMRWVRHDVPGRKGALKDLLEHVRLPLLNPTYFLEKVEMDGLIQDSKECIPLLHEARKYYILGNEVSSVRSRPRRFMELSEVIIVIGGCDKKGLLKLPFTDLYHPKSRQWTALSSVPGYTKSEFAACTLKNDVYISGGHISSNDVWVLSSQLNVWIKVACLQKGRWRHKMAALQGKIYAVGGFDGFYRLSSLECYDTFSNTWSTLAPLPQAVSSAAVVSCLNKLYVLGGAVDDTANTDKVQCYNPEDNKWTLLSPTPFYQRCISAVCLDNIIYVVGGLLSKIFSYDPRKDSWREVATLPGPLESCGLTVCGGKIYILGGRDENGEGTDKAFTFDPVTGSVEQQPPLQRCTSYHGCVTILQHTNR